MTANVANLAAEPAEEAVAARKAKKKGQEDQTAVSFVASMQKVTVQMAADTKASSGANPAASESGKKPASALTAADGKTAAKNQDALLKEIKQSLAALAGKTAESHASSAALSGKGMQAKVLLAAAQQNAKAAATKQAGSTGTTAQQDAAGKTAASTQAKALLAAAQQNAKAAATKQAGSTGTTAQQAQTAITAATAKNAAAHAAKQPSAQIQSAASEVLNQGKGKTESTAKTESANTQMKALAQSLQARTAASAGSAKTKQSGTDHSGTGSSGKSSQPDLTGSSQHRAALGQMNKLELWTAYQSGGKQAASADSVREQLADQFKTLLGKSSSSVKLGSGGVQTYTVTLYPEHLGKLTIAVSRGDQGLTAQLTAQTQQAKELIESGLDQLKKDCAKNGTPLAQIDVNRQLNQAAAQPAPDQKGQDASSQQQSGGQEQSKEQQKQQRQEQQDGEQLGHSFQEWMAGGVI